MTGGRQNFSPLTRLRLLYGPSGLLMAAGLMLGGARVGASPLADAAERRDATALRALLASEAKGDVNAAQADGMTALHWAAYHDSLEAGKALLAAGAKAEIANRYGVTPLSLACTNGNAVLVEALLAAGADANTALRGGETPLMTAARTGKAAVVHALLARGAKIDAKLPEGQTALMWAAAEGHLAVVEVLLAAGADFRTPLASGFTPMLFAARAGHAGVVSALLKSGADVNAATEPTTKLNRKLPRKGSSALTTAVENGHFELAALLVDAGANPNDLRSGFAPLHILNWIRKPDRGEDEGDPIPEGQGTMTSEQLIRKLVAKGADVNLQLTGGPKGGGRIDRNGCTPFLLAADAADTAYLKLLVEFGADPTIMNVDRITPLMAAAGLGTRSVEEEAGTDDEAVEAVGYLLTLGADINAVAGTGDTAMHGAAFANFPKTAKFLDAKGAKIEVWNQKNKRGWTPLLIAEGHRFGNFKPGFETIAAIKEIMVAHGVTPPPPTPPVAALGYEAL
jgi:ankyrin repeat protein